VHRSATGYRESGGRALHGGDLIRHRRATTSSAGSGRHHQIPPMGFSLRLHCPGLDHPFTSIDPASQRLTNEFRLIDV
jgi:hypothetical protein